MVTAYRSTVQYRDITTTFSYQHQLWSFATESSIKISMLILLLPQLVSHLSEEQRQQQRNG